MKIKNCVFVVCMLSILSIFNVFAKDPDYDGAFAEIYDFLRRCTYNGKRGDTAYKTAVTMKLNCFARDQFICDDVKKDNQGNCSGFSRCVYHIFEKYNIPSVIVHAIAEAGDSYNHIFNLFQDQNKNWKAFDPTRFIELEMYKTKEDADRTTLERAIFGQFIERGESELYITDLGKHLLRLNSLTKLRAVTVWNIAGSKKYFPDCENFLGLDIRVYDRFVYEQTGTHIINSTNEIFSPLNLMPYITLPDPYDPKFPKENVAFSNYLKITSILMSVPVPPEDLKEIMRNREIFPLEINS